MCRCPKQLLLPRALTIKSRLEQEQVIFGSVGAWNQVGLQLDDIQCALQNVGLTSTTTVLRQVY